MQKEPMTEYGYKKLQDELEALKEERPKVVVEIEKAKEHGDLRENAEYHAAKERLGFIDARLAELSDLLSRAQVIDPSKLPHEKVSFGSTVKLLDIEEDEEIEYTIVGATESNPEHGLISYNTPLARQLLGKEEGDEITVKLPKGEIDFEILEVYYKPIKFDK
ncbi:transcription elongation factor GreA [Nitrosophilus labii]|uniref:transcription elongation factor GreA n=1 Tax=Nitrosophilus labii TaxID=2706014 RepID=UPI0016569B9C|nr:transcription elongation factor GreA [Nitrosophilus labii]